MNVLVVDESKNFADLLSDFLSESSKECSVNYCDTLSLFNLSDSDEKYDVIFVSLDNISSRDAYYLSELSNLIGISPNPQVTRKFINNPLFQRIFQHPIDVVSIIKYLDNFYGPGLIHKNININVLNTLSKVGFTVNNNGTLYLAECIVEAKRNYYLKLKEVAELVAKKNNTTAQNVIWAMQNAINRTVCILGEDKIAKCFRLYDGRRPTPKYLIDYYANMI